MQCLPSGQKRRYVALSVYHPYYLEARRRNASSVFQREMRIRQTTAEGVFASQERLGWARSRLRGLRKVDCEGYISALAHNLKKAVRLLGDFAGPPEMPGALEPVAPLSV